MFARPSLAAAAACLALPVLALPALAADAIAVRDAYARASSPAAQSGAAFMAIENGGAADDRLVAAASDIAARVELHTHIMEDDVMRMVHVEEGFEIPAGETILLERGGKHVMFMGLNEPMEQGATVEVTLTFEEAGDVTVEIPVDLTR
jgi:hypothetical protein